MTKKAAIQRATQEVAAVVAAAATAHEVKVPEAAVLLWAKSAVGLALKYKTEQ